MMISKDIFSMIYRRLARANFKFLPCPFCGESPEFMHTFDTSDDQRYYDVWIVCCDLKYREESIAYRNGRDTDYGYLLLDAVLLKIGEYWNESLVLKKDEQKI